MAHRSGSHGHGNAIGNAKGGPSLGPADAQDEAEYSAGKRRGKWSRMNGRRTVVALKCAAAMAVAAAVSAGVASNATRRRRAVYTVDERSETGTGGRDADGHGHGHGDEGLEVVERARKSGWQFFDGDLNQYYNKLHRDELSHRNPSDVQKLAVHRWLGPNHSTTIHYEMIRDAIRNHCHRGAAAAQTSTDDMRVMDAGCGIGAGLCWFEQHEPRWSLVGYTISSDQHRFIQNELPPHRFTAHLRTFDEPDGLYDAIYSIEAFIHTTDAYKTLAAWSDALQPGGVLVIIDDYKAESFAKNEQKSDNDDNNNNDINDQDEATLFAKSWLANSFLPVSDLSRLAAQVGLILVQDRDVGTEFDVIRRNYRGHLPNLSMDGAKDHQAWMGAKLRHKLTVQGKITYRLLTFRKDGTNKDGKEAHKTGVGTMGQGGSYLSTSSGTGRRTQGEIYGAKGDDEPATCASVPMFASASATATANLAPAKNSLPTETDSSPVQSSLSHTPIRAQLRTGIGSDGGSQMECISGWYCCGKGQGWYDDLERTRTDRTKYLHLPRKLFMNHYLDVMARRLDEFYSAYPSTAANNNDSADKKATMKFGKFLDIGGAGSTVSGMTRVTSKFAHWAGPLEYWLLDSDINVGSMPQSISCDIAHCPQAETCGYDVTFSHTVLEHSSEPWLAFDEIARMTKKGGLTMHLVPFSYQYHATPDDYYRFSHSALTSLLENRNFTVLDVGYDICEQPPDVRKTRKDEHYEMIWLTYVVGRKH